jgi:Methyltransferase domain
MHDHVGPAHRGENQPTPRRRKRSDGNKRPGYYNVAEPGSLPTKVSRYQRHRMFMAFLRTMAPTAEDTVADVGVTCDRSHQHSNYLEAWYPHKSKIIAVGVEDASFLEQIYTGIKFVRGSGLQLPFTDRSFDIVHSSAVLEHVGSADEQARFLSELWRVARRGIFVTTPDGWFPIEVHTVLPFIHYLPARHYRHVLKKLGLEFFSKEANLNIMSRRSLSAAAAEAGINRFEIHSARLAGLSTNLMLVGKKDG